jgi:transcriptional regulator with XRE-family HTH domain
MNTEQTRLVAAVADRLRQLRASRGVSQQAVSEATGITQSQISRILQGQRAPYLDEFVTITSYFNTTPEKVIAEARAILEEQYGNVVPLSEPNRTVVGRAAARKGKGIKGDHDGGSSD